MIRARSLNSRRRVVDPVRHILSPARGFARASAWRARWRRSGRVRAGPSAPSAVLVHLLATRGEFLVGLPDRRWRPAGCPAPTGCRRSRPGVGEPFGIEGISGIGGNLRLQRRQRRLLGRPSAAPVAEAVGAAPAPALASAGWRAPAAAGAARSSPGRARTSRSAACCGSSGAGSEQKRQVTRRRRACAVMQMFVITRTSCRSRSGKSASGRGACLITNGARSMLIRPNCVCHEIPIPAPTRGAGRARCDRPQFGATAAWGTRPGSARPRR